MNFADVIMREIIRDYQDEPNVTTRVHGAWGRMVGGDADVGEVRPWASDGTSFRSWKGKVAKSPPELQEEWSSLDPV